MVINWGDLICNMVCCKNCLRSSFVKPINSIFPGQGFLSMFPIRKYHCYLCDRSFFKIEKINRDSREAAEKNLWSLFPEFLAVGLYVFNKNIRGSKKRYVALRKHQRFIPGNISSFFSSTLSDNKAPKAPEIHIFSVH